MNFSDLLKKLGLTKRSPNIKYIHHIWEYLMISEFVWGETRFEKIFPKISPQHNIGDLKILVIHDILAGISKKRLPIDAKIYHTDLYIDNAKVETLDKFMYLTGMEVSASDFVGRSEIESWHLAQWVFLSLDYVGADYDENLIVKHIIKQKVKKNGRKWTRDLKIREYFFNLVFEELKVQADVWDVPFEPSAIDLYREEIITPYGIVKDFTSFKNAIKAMERESP